MRKVYCLSIYSRYLVKSFAFSTIPCAFPHFPPSFPHRNFAELCIFIHNFVLRLYGCLFSHRGHICVYLSKCVRNRRYIRSKLLNILSLLKLKICFPHILRKKFYTRRWRKLLPFEVRVLSFRFASFLLFFNTVIRASLSISRRQKRHMHFTLHVPLLSPI